MRSSPAVAIRAFVALLMMGVFYGVALGFVGAMVCLAIWLYGLTADNVVGIQPSDQTWTKVALYIATLFALVAAAFVLWMLRPRRDRFVAPGPRLLRMRQPGLFDELESVARAMSQREPDEIHLTWEYNASIGVRGGFLGIGRRRVLFLGLPFVRSLSRAQLRAVLAHELGHVHAGDLRFGPIIHAARRTIIGMVTTLGADHSSGVVQRFLVGYAKLFLRLTQSASRHQELVADEIAGRTEGPKNLIAGLQITSVGDHAFDAYWYHECMPVLSSGFLPPLATGFDQFLRSEQVAKFAAKDLAWKSVRARAEPYDSHPPLEERVAALELIDDAVETSGREPAIGLLEDLPELERELIAHIADPERVKDLVVIPWSEVGRRVYLPHWRTLVAANAQLLSGMRTESLPALAKDRGAFQSRLVSLSAPPQDSEERRMLMVNVVGAAIMLLLVRRGALVDATPGKPIRARIGSRAIEPFEVISRLIKGEMTAAAWLAQCEQLAIDGASLAAGERVAA